MAINYTILKSSIIHSSLWITEDSDTRCVWIAMLAMRNKDGEVFSSLIGLADAAKVSPEKTAAALEKFKSPDIYSTTKENEGRRIKEIQGGWLILNHEKIKQEARQANKAAYMANYMSMVREHKRTAKKLGDAGEAEYLAAIKRGASDDELNGIVTKHLPKDCQ